MSAGPYSIGSNVWPGLSKLIEEMGETGQVVGKLIATGGETAHWDGTDLRERLSEETADLAAAIAFVASVNGLDTVDWHARVSKKLAQFKAWHREQGGDIPTDVRPEVEPAVQAAIRGLERVAPETLGTYGQEANDAVRSDESSKGSRGAEARDAGADVQVRADDPWERVPRPQAGMSDVARMGEGARDRHAAEGGPVDGATVTTTPGHVWQRDASGGSALVPTLTDDERDLVIAAIPIAQDGGRVIAAEMAVTTGEPWTPKVGDRVVTTEKLTDNYSPVSWPHRRPGAAGRIAEYACEENAWMVRHDDGADAPYDADELRPEKR